VRKRTATIGAAVAVASAVALRGPTPAATPPQPARAVRIDPDRADAATLALLPGVGPGLAARIVADRAERGPFEAPEELARVRGIGPATLEAMRPYLSFAPSSAPAAERTDG